ncbi:MAG: urea ABC transporter permease subunit UrtB [Verrucomicrobia bacterium]|nr:urea ABC transporter permease subunit UrtB [Verrucomicrobiota bacterium]
MTRTSCRTFTLSFALLALLCTHVPAQSSDDATLREQLQRLASDDHDVRHAAVLALAGTGDLRLEALFTSYHQGSLYVWNDQIVLGGDSFEADDLFESVPLSDPLTRMPITENGKALAIRVDDLIEISPDRNERSFILSAKYLLRLSSADADERLSGAKKCGDPPWVHEAREELLALAQSDPVKIVRRTAHESVLLLDFQNSLADLTGHAHQETVKKLADAKSMRGLPRIEDQQKQLSGNDTLSAENHRRLEAAYTQAISRIKGHIKVVERYAGIFQGLSLGSVLILMALGLAITFGLMGVINMAHGEFMMIGAYATYEMQRLFVKLIENGSLPASAFDWYYVAALPFAFLMAALVGLMVEVSVIRFLYRKPLESLLATWGVGIILIQLVRLRYGDNIGVNAPTWARGGIEVMQDVVLPYSRCFIIVLCGLAMAMVTSLMRKTRVGLRMRATMQNRDMAKGLGVNTERVDRFTFALGSGLAGIAGYSWTLIGCVTPDMGQKNFIVDSFLVVVTGGVGELLGVVCSGLGIGLLTKLVEPLQIGSFTVGAIWAKVLLLIAIATFIQFKPAGLFAPKGRLADV